MATCHLGYTLDLQVLGYTSSWLHFASSGLERIFCLGLHGILATLWIFRSWAHLQVLGYMVSWLHFASSGLGYMVSWLHFGSSGLGRIFRSWATWYLGYTSHLQVWATWHLGYTSQLQVLGASLSLGLYGILATLWIFRSWVHLQVMGYIASWLFFGF